MRADSACSKSARILSSFSLRLFALVAYSSLDKVASPAAALLASARLRRDSFSLSSGLTVAPAPDVFVAATPEGAVRDCLALCSFAKSGSYRTIDDPLGGVGA